MSRLATLIVSTWAMNAAVIEETAPTPIPSPIVIVVSP